MLALTRKKDESIIINGNIVVTVMEVKGDHVKLGIQAPKNVSIYRKEIYEQIQKENEEAMNTKNVQNLKDLL
ncbi:MAG: carbon storage regulator [Lachnospiraceae bacterium]|uniref:Translational regulator CsrA n=1 Tax=Candidatus Weimeria bifida TaxID=2599074 RepID=A0A6N7J135_9FIRM|nr:carbon storage regulator CsrA [Candidatus Weimeria bifida]RRF97392.1 MAG: carbon storage regulator [Lachnospiraceae bacterium]